VALFIDVYLEVIKFWVVTYTRKVPAGFFFKIEYDDNVIIIFIYLVFLDDKEKSNTIGALLVFLAAFLMTMSF
jgi:hypothetical protein